MSSTPTPHRPSDDLPRIKFWRVALPVALSGLGILILILLLVLPFSPISFQDSDETSALSTLFVCCFALLPMMLCMLPISALLVAAIFSVNKLERGSRYRLKKIKQTTHRLADTTEAKAENIAKKSIGLGTRFAFLGTFFERASGHTDDHKKLEGDHNDE